MLERYIAIIINVQAYCLCCRRHAGNIGSQKVTITNKVTRQKSTCANFMSDKLK